MERIAVLSFVLNSYGIHRLSALNARGAGRLDDSMKWEFHSLLDECFSLRFASRNMENQENEVVSMK